MPQSGLIRKNCTLNRTQRRGVRINISSTGVAGGVFQTAAVVNYDRQLRVHGSLLGGGAQAALTANYLAINHELLQPVRPRY